MDYPRYPADHEPRKEGEQSSFHFHVAGLLWTVLTTAVSGIISLVSWQIHLWSTFWLASISAVLVVFFIYRNKVHSIQDQSKVFFAWLFLIAVILYVDMSSASLLILNEMGKPRDNNPPSVTVAADDLEGAVFSGFRTATGASPSFVVLTIEEVTHDQTRALFRYSLNQGLQLHQGQGMIYSETSTMTLRDGTRFHYARENGILTLRAFGAGYSLSQVASRK